jgi:hypothetical protein
MRPVRARRTRGFARRVGVDPHSGCRRAPVEGRSLGLRAVSSSGFSGRLLLMAEPSSPSRSATHFHDFPRARPCARAEGAGSRRCRDSRSFSGTGLRTATTAHDAPEQRERFAVSSREALWVPKCLDERMIAAPSEASARAGPR